MINLLLALVPLVPLLLLNPPTIFPTLLLARQLLPHRNALDIELPDLVICLKLDAELDTLLEDLVEGFLQGLFSVLWDGYFLFM